MVMVMVSVVGLVLVRAGLLAAGLVVFLVLARWAGWVLVGLWLYWRIR